MATIGPVPRRKRIAAAEHILGIATGLHNRRRAEGFLRSLKDCFGEPVLIWAREGRATTAASMVVTSEGYVGFVYHSPPLHEATDPAVLPEVIREATRLAMDRGTKVVQAMQTIDDPAAAEAVAAVGYMHLADLIHMECELGEVPPPMVAEDVAFLPYDRYSEAVLRDVVAATYVDSLDCPRLAGRREMADVIASHRTTGEFSPASWWLVTVGGVAAGCLLMNAHRGQPCVRDIVYMGMVAEFRGRGLGRAMLRHAAGWARTQGADRLTLAVDAGNTPAVRLYRGAGFVETRRQACWIYLPAGV